MNVNQNASTAPDITAEAHAYRKRLFPGFDSPLTDTDPEFVERMDNFAFGDVPAQDDLDDRTRLLAIMASLIGSQALDMFKAMAKGAFNVGVTPVEVKELVYQSTPYVGMGRMLAFLYAVNELLEHRLITLPLEGQATTTRETRFEAGAKKQADLFGSRTPEAFQTGVEGAEHIDRWLAENCFGDYYTRTGLDDAQREMAAFCMIVAQGGCDQQAREHAQANMRIGNDRAFLIKVVSQCLPYIGYPRSLNALRCIDEAAEALEQQ